MSDTVQAWTKRCKPYRHVTERAVLDKLRMCQEAGVDIDKIPMSLTVGDLVRMSVQAIGTLTNATSSGQ